MDSYQTTKKNKSRKGKGKKKTPADIRRYAFYSSQPKSEPDASSKEPSAREQRKAEHARLKAQEAREAERETEMKKFEEDKATNLRKNSDLVAWFNKNYSDLSEDELYWLTSTLGELSFEPGYVLYLTADKTVIGYIPSYNPERIWVDSSCISFWEGKCPGRALQQKIPETIRSFVEKHTLSESPDESEFPEQGHTQTNESYYQTRRDFVGRWIQDRVPK